MPQVHDVWGYAPEWNCKIRSVKFLNSKTNEFRYWHTGWEIKKWNHLVNSETNDFRTQREKMFSELQKHWVENLKSETVFWSRSKKIEKLKNETGFLKSKANELRSWRVVTIFWTPKQTNWEPKDWICFLNSNADELRAWRVKLFAGHQSKWVENPESGTAFWTPMQMSWEPEEWNHFLYTKANELRTQRVKLLSELQCKWVENLKSETVFWTPKQISWEPREKLLSWKQMSCTTVWFS
jgi:tRNA G37 N-methylase Trm5